MWRTHRRPGGLLAGDPHMATNNAVTYATGYGARRGDWLRGS
ncbi:MAG: hypothetical protein R3B91_07625 [Planctomycetaceae bacterium]